MSNLLEIAKHIDAGNNHGKYKSINSPDLPVKVAWLMNHYINCLFTKRIKIGDSILKAVDESTCEMVFGCDGCGCVIADSKKIYIDSISYMCKTCKIRVDMCSGCQIIKAKSLCCKSGKTIFNDEIILFQDELAADIETCKLLIHIYVKDNKYYWDWYENAKKVETRDLTDMITKALKKRKNEI